jgi:hypothetical protein
MKKVTTAALLLALFSLVGCERAQRGLYDAKADVSGTKRKASVYSQHTSNPLFVVEDDKMVIDRSADATTLWRGSVNRKVHISNNAIIIVEDL